MADLLDTISAVRVDLHDRRPELLEAGAKIAHELARVLPKEKKP